MSGRETDKGQRGSVTPSEGQRILSITIGHDKDKVANGVCHSTQFVPPKILLVFWYRRSNSGTAIIKHLRGIDER